MLRRPDVAAVSSLDASNSLVMSPRLVGGVDCWDDAPTELRVLLSMFIRDAGVVFASPVDATVQSAAAVDEASALSEEARGAAEAMDAVC